MIPYLRKSHDGTNKVVGVVKGMVSMWLATNWKLVFQEGKFGKGIIIIWSREDIEQINQQEGYWRRIRQVDV